MAAALEERSCEEDLEIWEVALELELDGTALTAVCARGRAAGACAADFAESHFLPAGARDQIATALDRLRTDRCAEASAQLSAQCDDARQELERLRETAAALVESTRAPRHVPHIL